MGLKEFVIDRMNIFDIIIAMLSLGETIFMEGSGSGSAISALRVIKIKLNNRLLEYLKHFECLELLD